MSADATGEEVARELSSRLHRFRPAANVRIEPLGGGHTAVDFTLGFPDEPLAPIPSTRRGNAGNSAVIIGQDGGIREFTLRFPPLPADEYNAHETASIITSAVGSAHPAPSAFNLKAEPGQGGREAFNEGDVESWWPHVELHPPNRVDFDVDGFLQFLRDTYHAYRDEVKP